MRHSIRDVEAAIAARYRLTRDEMRGPNRARAIARPRQIAMVLAREMTGQSLPRIGAHFRRDHTTVIHALRCVARLCARDAAFAAEVQACRAAVGRFEPWMARAAAELRAESGSAP
jgi:chromosomal replication initiator protein